VPDGAEPAVWRIESPTVSDEVCLGNQHWRMNGKQHFNKHYA
jgi:anti-sigma factor ChrR (cupin superfamily)